MNNEQLELHGTGWCPKSAVLRNFLQSKWIEFDDYNVETDKSAEAKVRALYDGKLKFPTVIKGDRFIKNPSIPELIKFLEEA